MKNSMKVILTAAMILAAALLFSGCWMKDVDELYKLPQQSEEYIQLQGMIEEVLNNGAEYISPTSGSHRQSVQLIDLNGDGNDEAVVFFKNTADSDTDKALKIYIFENIDDEYREAAVIEGDGTGIESVDYEDLTGDGCLDIVVGWKISSEIRMLNVYSMDKFEAAVIATTDYSEYSLCNIDGRGSDELVVIHFGTSENKGVVEMYTFGRNGEVDKESADLSKGIESIDSVKSGFLSDGKPALFVEGAYGDNGVITDIFASINRKFTNITLNDSGISTSTVRNYAVYATDIDHDGVMEIPALQYLNTEDGQTRVWLFQWYTYSVTGSHISRVSKCATFHDYSDGWYFEVPEDWPENITIRREDKDTAERVIVFSVWNGSDEPPVDFMSIYTLTGNNRYKRAEIKGRFTIYDDGDTIYAAKIITEAGNSEYLLSEDDIISRFHIIQTEWFA